MRLMTEAGALELIAGHYSFRVLVSVSMFSDEGVDVSFDLFLNDVMTDFLFYCLILGTSIWKNLYMVLNHSYTSPKTLLVGRQCGLCFCQTRVGSRRQIRGNSVLLILRSW